MKATAKVDSAGEEPRIKKRNVNERKHLEVQSCKERGVHKKKSQHACHAKVSREYLSLVLPSRV